MNNSNEILIRQFYEAFSRGDGQTMADAYHKDAEFSDPVFQNLKGFEIGMMWKMLCLQSSSLKVVAKNIWVEGENGKADWSAHYTFGKSKRNVHNKIHADFTFKDGKVIKHTDHFDFWKWSRMALGPLGLFMGWNSVVQAKVSQQAMANLTKFITMTKNT